MNFLPAAHVHRRRLVIVEQVAGVDAAGFREQVHGDFGVRQRRGEIAGALLAGVLEDGLHRILDHGALLRFVHAVGVARVVDAVAEEFPVALLAEFDDLRVVFAQRRRQRNRAAHAVLVQHLHHAHVADAVAVVAGAVAVDVGHRPRPGLAMRVHGRVQFVELDIGCDPEGHAGAVWPLDFRAVLVGPVVVQTGIFFPA